LQGIGKTRRREWISAEEPRVIALRIVVPEGITIPRNEDAVRAEVREKRR
jgi:hypothetical protein